MQSPAGWRLGIRVPDAAPRQGLRLEERAWPLGRSGPAGGRDSAAGLTQRGASAPGSGRPPVSPKSSLLLGPLRDLGQVLRLLLSPVPAQGDSGELARARPSPGRCEDLENGAAGFPLQFWCPRLHVPEVQKYETEIPVLNHSLFRAVRSNLQEPYPVSLIKYFERHHIYTPLLVVHC